MGCISVPKKTQDIAGLKGMAGDDDEPVVEKFGGQVAKGEEESLDSVSWCGQSRASLFLSPRRVL